LYSKGNFTGLGGARITHRPLPLGVIDEKWRELLTTKLVQPIAAYEAYLNSGKNENPSINWPPDMIVHFQEAFSENFVLSSAWQEVPLSTMIGICEEVRNRLLQFALEIKSELGDVDDKVAAVPPENVQKVVTNVILGGVNIFGGTVGNITQIGSIQVGDLAGLIDALTQLKIGDAEIDKLKAAIDADRQGFGTRTKEWIKKAGKFVVQGGAKVGAALGQEILKEYLLRYFGLK
jgi:hypothetical protein